MEALHASSKALDDIDERCSIATQTPIKRLYYRYIAILHSVSTQYTCGTETTLLCLCIQAPFAHREKRMLVHIQHTCAHDALSLPGECSQGVQSKYSLLHCWQHIEFKWLCWANPELHGQKCRIEAAVIAALLHDTVDDTRVSLEEIYDVFGPRVAQIVGQVGQLSTTTQLLRRRHRRDVSMASQQSHADMQWISRPTIAPASVFHLHAET